jgi:NADPH-dependent glutamate synthase beta subunit-like oxidoreductase/NAD-dependent dihydropyrimidine dehydrogenase PreA subunit
MIEALYMMGGLGLLVGVGLAAASKIFYVYVDPQILAIEEALPGANCGGCGLPGCSANAEAIVAGRAAPNSCVAAGEETAEEIAGILGVAVEAKEPDIARPGCTYGVADADTKFVYNGMNDCRAAAMLAGGMKVCTIGCLGLGTCVRACPFNAITMGADGLPEVDEALCTGCGTCERVCPKHIINLSSVTRRILREYTTDDCTTPCQRACPAGINICEYIRQISLGDYQRAVQVIKERNPFPAVIGRICPRPCEVECRRQYVDEPVAINFLKRYAADTEIEKNERSMPYKAPATGRKVAVAGGGVQGLSAAFFLARLGHEATVYEATEKLGGLLRSAIDRFRLPEEILDWDIAGVIEMGVNAETGKVLGKDITVSSLLGQGHQAVLLASGGWDSRLARGAFGNIDSPIPGTLLLIDFMAHIRQTGTPMELPADVVICGGGPLALEAADACRRMGAQKITVLYRETAAELELDAHEIQRLRSENIDVRFQTGVFRLSGENDRLIELGIVDLASRETRTLQASTLILSAGRFPELIFSRIVEDVEQAEEDTPAVAVSQALKWQAVDPYKEPSFRTEIGLFAKGDVFTDYSAAIRAIGAGRRAAASVHEIMYGISLQLPDNVVAPETPIQNVDHVEEVSTVARSIMPVRAAKDLSAGRELEVGFDQDAARREADRCLQCGLICYLHSGAAAQKVS